MALSVLSSQANGTGTAVVLAFPFHMKMHRFRRTLYVYGTFDSSTAKLQISPDGSNWFDAASASFTAAGYVNLETQIAQVRGVVSGGSGSESINMILLPG